MPDDTDARTEQLYVRVTPAEKEKINAVIDVDEYENMSAFLRECAVNPAMDRYEHLREQVGLDAA